MKKKIIIIMVTLLALIGLSGTLVACGDGALDKNGAKLIALADVGATEAQATYIVADREEINGSDYYKVELQIEGVSYYYLISARDGSIQKQQINDQTVSPGSAPATPYRNPESYISLAEAKAVALSDAGVSEAEVQSLESELDYAFGTYLYEIEFMLQGVEYEYEINATDGSIFEKSVGRKTVTAPTTESYISTEEALSKALLHASLASDQVTVTEAHWELNKGVAVYEIEFYTATIEYDYTVHAVSGEILKAENDSEKIIPSTEAVLSREEALSLAYLHAGINASQATEVSVELDVDHGVTEYEIEFKAGGYEYEYSVNAVSGAIIHTEKEIID